MAHLWLQKCPSPNADQMAVDASPHAEALGEKRDLDRRREKGEVKTEDARAGEFGLTIHRGTFASNGAVVF